MKSTEKSEVYKGALEYWRSVAASDDGMLCGFAHLSAADSKNSRRFIRQLIQKHGLIADRALDCGSGIGRVSKYTLLPIFRTVDMADVTREFLDASTSYLGDALDARVDRKLCCGLQDLEPEPGRYDLVWIQWVAGHLTDDDLVAFLKRCRLGLKRDDVVGQDRSFIVVKENVVRADVAGGSDFDDTDKSWTRSEQLLKQLFLEAGLKLVAQRPQDNFPEGMYKIISFALQ